MHLPDINVWLALTFDSHVHHPAAKVWFDALADEHCFFCRMTQQGCAPQNAAAALKVAVFSSESGMLSRCAEF
jgi:hypothetical protein